MLEGRGSNELTGGSVSKPEVLTLMRWVQANANGKQTRAENVARLTKKLLDNKQLREQLAAAVVRNAIADALALLDSNARRALRMDAFISSSIRQHDERVAKASRRDEHGEFVMPKKSAAQQAGDRRANVRNWFSYKIHGGKPLGQCSVDDLTNSEMEHRKKAATYLANAEFEAAVLDVLRGHKSAKTVMQAMSNEELQTMAERAFCAGSG